METNVEPAVTVMSKSANPSEISFLDLPPEACNRVYSLIFEHADPLRITGYGARRLYRHTDDQNSTLVASKCQPKLYYTTRCSHPRPSLPKIANPNLQRGDTYTARATSSHLTSSTSPNKGSPSS